MHILTCALFRQSWNWWKRVRMRRSSRFRCKSPCWIKIVWQTVLGVGQTLMMEQVL